MRAHFPTKSTPATGGRNPSVPPSKKGMRVHRLGAHATDDKPEAKASPCRHPTLDSLALHPRKGAALQLCLVQRVRESARNRLAQVRTKWNTSDDRETARSRPDRHPCFLLGAPRDMTASPSAQDLKPPAARDGRQGRGWRAHRSWKTWCYSGGETPGSAEAGSCPICKLDEPRAGTDGLEARRRISRETVAIPRAVASSACRSPLHSPGPLGTPAPRPLSRFS
ncbi:hypothetical protein DFH09DRAFT_1379617 [Mycena vulgaris]|nr:hypothetical protein DFH09DRAFT_1379617 [Mycena vulgaris]